LPGHISRKTLVLLDIGLVLALVGLLMAPLYALAAKSRVKNAKPAKKLAVTAKTEEKPEILENFVLLFTGNWSGKLEPCGCTERQLGGIDRRSHILRGIPKESRLLGDAGPLIEKSNRQGQLKLETFLYSLKQLEYDVITLTADEIIMLNETIGIAPEQRSPIVLSNTNNKTSEKIGTIRCFKKELLFGDHKLGCLVLALAEPVAASAKSYSRDMEILEPIATIKKLLADKSNQAELVIVMAASNNEKLLKGLGGIKQIDILVRVGYTDEPEMRPSGGDGPLIITTGKLGKYIARVDLPLEEKGRCKNARFSTIAIEEHFPRDPVIIEFMETYQESMKIEELIADEEAIVRLPLRENNHFVGNESCGETDCHEDIYATWQKFGHSKAIETLQRPDVQRQFDPECVGCHTVGMKYETGYRSMEKTPQLAEVGCEMCHGPGWNHCEDVYAEYQVVFTSCEQCHDHETSPEFEEKREEYFEKIRHWEETRKYWD